MLELAALAPMPLAQFNSTTAPGPGGSTAPQAPVPAAPPAPAPPGPAGPNAEAPATHGVGGSMGPGGNATSQNTSQPGGTGKENVPAAGSPWGGIAQFLPIILIFVALYLFLFRGQKKEEKRRKALLAEMKKGDKVQTVGGLVARVISIDNDDVVLKIDESANVRAVYKKSAILHVIVPPDEKAK